MKNLVVFDVDGVLADFEGQLVKVLVSEFGEVARQKRNCFRLEDRFAERPDILSRAKELVSDPNFYYGLREIDGAFGFVDMVMDEGKGVVFVSSRPDSAQSFTARWLLKRMYKGKPVVFCGIEDKVGFLKPILESVDFVVEDNPQHIADLKSAGIDVICFDQPWNQGIFPRLYIRSDGEPMLWAQEDLEAEPFFAVEME